MGLGSSADEYREQLIKLSPQGQCWPTDEGSTWYELLDAIAQEYARIDEHGVTLLNEAFPDTTDALLSDWERTLGLPDEFSDPGASEEERRQYLLFKIRARGGQSAAYLSGLIDTLGYENEIQECYPFAADTGEAGGYLFDETWIYYFLVIVQGPVFDEALFEARFRSIQPAQSVSIFIYE